MNGAERARDAEVGYPQAGWRILGAGDFDGDGLSDILWRSTDNTRVAVWRMKGEFVIEYVPAQTISSTLALRGIADLNRDGVSDVLWSFNGAAGRLNYQAWYSMSGTLGGRSNARLATDIETTWQVAGLGDINGDGYGDLIWRNTGGDGRIAIWYFAGPATQGGQPTKLGEGYPRGPVPSSWSVQGIGDFDGDWKSDVLWRDSNGQVAIWNILQTGGADWYPGLADSTWIIRGAGSFN